ncbi:hypothetical protein [Lewinella sp. 4G2]|uniref:hypothetical protein n=1 Tax=Lewinella sp. 4G2 TaxID=1803372 RepID=UPI0007B4D25E|nr:hypothetical protein [Lewinella sp. 4G2]OAV44209.1 hypothetical protein A3850_006745 [Lewinella sp. 4G2]
MKAQQLLRIVTDLEGGIDPTTQHPFDLATSSIAVPDVRAALSELKLVLTEGSASNESIPDTLLLETHRELVALGYQPVPEQLVRVLRGSRSIADANLKAVTAYGTLRAKYSKRYIIQTIADFARRHSALFANSGVIAPKPKKERSPHLDLPFFREERFDKLTDEKALELKTEIDKLGFARPTDKLPEFKRRARKNYPRAYEPWTRAEHALLIETMCYTNDAERIATLFGRTAKSITDAGLKLIYNSKQNAA